MTLKNRKLRIVDGGTFVQMVGAFADSNPLVETARAVKDHAPVNKLLTEPTTPLVMVITDVALALFAVNTVFVPATA